MQLLRLSLYNIDYRLRFDDIALNLVDNTF